MNMASWYVYSDINADTYGITPKYILTKEILGFDNKMIVGVDYYNEPYRKDFFSDRERTVKSSTADFTRASLEFDIRDEFSILKDLVISGGYRSERTDISGSNTDFSNPEQFYRYKKNL